MVDFSPVSIKRDILPIAVRAYNQPAKPAYQSDRSTRIGASKDWAIVFDTETTADQAQGLRLGTYQIRYKGELHKEGFFIDPDGLSDPEKSTLNAFVSQRDLSVISKTEFVEEVIYGIGYDLGAMIIGFNLPFDLSRLAISHSRARGKMYGGFSFKLSENSFRPRLRIKHLSRRASLINFAKPGEQKTPRSMRRKADYVRPSPGFFLDLKTIAAALTSRSHTLKSLAEYLDTKHKKSDAGEHGAPLDFAYLDYALMDTQVTWECYEKLCVLYGRHNLSTTPMEHIYSEAGIGKAYLAEMGIKPWRVVQPDFAPEMSGKILSSFYGGRAEVGLRRTVQRIIYCDFLSMYPTVCSLMDLWQWVNARGINYHDCTAETQAFLDNITLSDMANPNTWPKLNVLVELLPDDDIFPVRSQYPQADGQAKPETQFTTGLNYLTSKQSLCYTLADCISSKLLTGKIPKVFKAHRFEPQEPQENIQPVDIAGDSGFHVDPEQHDFYRRLIEFRQGLKAAIPETDDAAEKARLKTAELAIKILANSVSYGIFVELNNQDLCKPKAAAYFGLDGMEYEVQTDQIEEPGKYFHPFIGSLITGAARLMLALAEHLASREGLGWMFCDTDSMAFLAPPEMPIQEFKNKVDAIRRWFAKLNPYAVEADIFKLEDLNFRTAEDEKDRVFDPPYCFAISAKRYAIFNLGEDGMPIIRKASGHGLGHLYPPYETREALPDLPMPLFPVETLRDKVGVTLWQHDHWYRIIMQALGKPFNVPEIDKLLEQPAVIRYGANTPDLLDWFHGYNRKRSYRDQVKPFNFLFSLQLPLFDTLENIPNSGERSDTRKTLKPIKAAAPFHSKIDRALKDAFDRETGDPIDVARLKTYRSALAQFHRHPEAKFANGSFTNVGFTVRRHVDACEIYHIGKEANRLEQRQFLGDDEKSQMIYEPVERGDFKADVQAAIDLYGQKSHLQSSPYERTASQRYSVGS